MPPLAARLRWQNACVGDAPAWAICSLQRATSAARGSPPPSSIAPPWGVVSMHSILHPPRFVKRAARKTNRFVRRQDAVFAAGVWTTTDNAPCPLYRENPSAAKCPRQAFGRYFLGHVPGRGRQAKPLSAAGRPVRASAPSSPLSACAAPPLPIGLSCIHIFIGDRCIGPVPRFPSPPPPERRALIRAG